MELETIEEIHSICLFPNLESALIFEKDVAECMPKIKNREDIFGEEWYIDSQDEKIRKEEKLLLVASSMTLIEAYKKVIKLGGICYPAHVDRDSYSIISVLGDIPTEYTGKVLEISSDCNIKQLIGKYSSLKNYKLISSSDSHTLSDVGKVYSLVHIAQENQNNISISSVIKALND